MITNVHKYIVCSWLWLAYQPVIDSHIWLWAIFLSVEASDTVVYATYVDRDKQYVTPFRSGMPRRRLKRIEQEGRQSNCNNNRIERIRKRAKDNWRKCADNVFNVWFSYFKKALRNFTWNNKLIFPIWVIRSLQYCSVAPTDVHKWRSGHATQSLKFEGPNHWAISAPVLSNICIRDFILVIKWVRIS